MKAKHWLSTAFHLQMDGQTEQQNQVLEHYLCSYIDYQQDDWVTKLAMAEFTYNNSVHSTTEQTSFYTMYGYHPEFTWDIKDDAPGGGAPAACDCTAQIAVIRKQLLK